MLELERAIVKLVRASRISNFIKPVSFSSTSFVTILMDRAHTMQFRARENSVGSRRREMNNNHASVVLDTKCLLAQKKNEFEITRPRRRFFCEVDLCVLF